MHGRDGLLRCVRVLDVGEPESDAVGRILADLGADVIRVVAAVRSGPEPDADPATRRGLEFLMHNANKRCLTVDPGDPAHRIAELARTADIVIDCGGRLAQFGTSCAELTGRHPHLVGLQVTDFGSTGPRAGWIATDAVLYAMSTSLSRSGPTSGRPVLPPRGIAAGTAATQAAWAVLVAYFRRLRCGQGELVDFSRYEGVLQALDPPFGVEGQAAVGTRAPAQLWRGRPRNQQLYPVFECADGAVRICLLSARQWHGMRRWLGDPEHLRDPELDSVGGRMRRADEITVAIGELCRPRTMDDLVEAGQRCGVPISAVLAPADALHTDHVADVGALARITAAGGAAFDVPVGPVVVDRRHPGFAPPSVDADAAWEPRPMASPELDADRGARPFDGVRIVDLGVIVAGGELSRLFADLGADVIKVESADYPDGLRQAPPGMPISRSWALAHRNSRSLGLDLRDPRGAELFAALVADADLVFANFKPGTLAALGFSYDWLRSVNPRIVLAESSAFGASGPWSGRMGYGPLVRAGTGITRLWTSPDAETDSGATFDATTIFPDHVAARLAAVGALAALIRRRRSGEGARVHVSQAEAAVNQLAVTYAADAARAAGLPVADDGGWDLVSPCRGDDEWCVVSVRHDADHTALARCLELPELPPSRDALVEAVSAWTAGLDQFEVAEMLQRNGIPSAPMLRAVEVLGDPQVTAREFYADLRHPLLAEPIPSETAPARYRHIPRAELRPAPMPGEHTRDIARMVLHLDDAQTDRLIAEGVLFAAAPQTTPRG